MEQTVNYGNLTINYVYEIINPSSSFVMGGYFWGKNNVNKNNKDGLTYGQLADRLVEKCKKNNCNYFLAEVPEFSKPGGYQKAINYKPTFILETLKIIHPRKLATIDTDMTVERYPSLFDMDYDFMGYNWYYEPHQIEPEVGPMDCFDPYVLHTSGGMLVFSNTEQSIELLKHWKEASDIMPGKAEDRLLGIVFNSNMMLPKLRCLWLPLSYFYIPYYYELEDEFKIPKKYQHAFSHLNFVKNYTKKSYTFDQVYKFNLKKDIYIHHPESLTTEEEAARQGADNDRIPFQFYIETGKKLKCFNSEKGLLNNTSIYCDTKEDERSFKNTNNLLEVLGYSKNVKKIKNIKKSKHEDFVITRHHINNKDNLVIVFSNSSFVPSKSKNYSYICIERNQKSTKSSIIFNIMNNTNKNVLFFENLIHIDLENFMKNHYDPSVDFACINSNSEVKPIYSSYYAPACYDPRSLFAITTDLLYFSNNKLGKNLLKLWDEELTKKTFKFEDRYALSSVFNRFMYIIYSRVKWFSPFIFSPKTRIFKDSINNNFNSNVTKFDKKIKLYDFFKQCNNKGPLTKYGNVLKEHFFNR
jgi:hypothetical protein